MEFEVDKLPFDGYAEAYLERRSDMLGKKHYNIVFGKPYTDIADAPTGYELPCDTYKHIGKVKITISETLDITKNEEGTAE
jgi:hypothetical protein